MRATLETPRLPSTEDAVLPVPQREITGGVTGRVVLVSLLLAAFFGYVVPVVDFKFDNTFLGANHLPVGAVGVLLVMLLVVNPLLKLLSWRLSFGRNEILTIYTTCLFSCLVPGRGSETFFITNVIGSFYYATRENKWLDFLQPYLKPWMTPALDAKGHYIAGPIAGWYEGLSAGQAIPWGAWAVPIAAWTAIIFALYAMLACLGVMLRLQWAQREALSFPLLRLPLEMTEGADDRSAKPGAFFRSPLMWIGFGIVVGIQLLNGLNLYFPDVPRIPLDLPTGDLLTEAPWNQIGGLTIRVFPLVIGVTYLLTSEISFSLWFFLLFHKAQLLGAYSLGFMPSTLPDPVWTRGFAKGFIGYQQFGAFFAYSFAVLWLGREHFGHIARRAFGLTSAHPEEKTEALSYPLAFWGFWASLSFVVAWTVAAGVQWNIALLLWATYLVIAVGLTRLVVEAGLLMVHTGWAPLGPWSGLIGSAVSPSSAVPASVIGGALMTELRGFLMPSYLHAFKLAHDQKIPARPLLALISLCVALAFGVGVWTSLHLGYDNGGLSLQEWWARGAGAQAPARNAALFVRGIQDSFALNWAWSAVGFFVTCGLMAARARFAWFPLHPLGYIIFTPYAMVTLWFSIFLGWLIKSLILRFGGTQTYRSVTPFFLGLILGDVTMMIFWVCIDAWQGRTGHVLMR